MSIGGRRSTMDCIWEIITSPSLDSLLLIPISYVMYRVTRTTLALLQAIFVYWLAPLVYRPSLRRYRMRWTVVTGGTDGIGKAYTLELARRGLRKFYLIGRNQEKLDKVKAELEAIHADCYVKTLLFEFGTSQDYSYLRENLASLDIGFALNSVGVGREQLERYGDNPEADSHILRINALGAAEFLSCVLPPMEAHGGGQVVVLSSSQGYRPIPWLAAYSASKTLMTFLAEAIDRERATIRVQTLTPALVATNMTYYTRGSLFVVMPENFARQAVSSLGLVRVTSGCFNHEVQLLMCHLFPWTLLKYLIIPIYAIQKHRCMQRVVASAQEKADTNNNADKAIDVQIDADGGEGSVEKEKLVVDEDGGATEGVPTSPTRRGSRIPTATSGAGAVQRSHA